MRRRYKKESNEIVRNKLIGLGENSIRKSYYPELRERINELERFRVLVQHANDALFVLDAFSWSFADVNNTAATKTGYSREDLIDSPPELIFPEETCFKLHDILTGEKGDVVWDGGYTTELLGKTGGSIPVEMTSKVHFAGGHLYLVMVARDVRRRLADRVALRKTRNYLGNVIDSMQSVLVGVDENVNVVLWNAYATKKTGVRAEEAQGRFLFDVIPELKRFESLIAETIDGTVSGVTDIYQVKSGRDKNFYEIVVSPFEAEDEAGAVVRVDDITERIRMEEVMVQTEKMMTVGGLAAGMAHEINNPLSGILQGVQNVQRRLLDDLESNKIIARDLDIPFEKIALYCEERGVLKNLESIREMGKRSAKIVSNMLKFSRESGGEKNYFDLAKVVSTAIDLSFSGYDICRKTDNCKVEFIRDIDNNLPSIVCSPSEIEQVVINLLKNSVQAILSYSETDREKFFIAVRLKQESSFVRLEVEDNGPGMDRETRKNALEPFFTTKPAGEGTGLGLFVSYFIITQKHGGTFKIETSAGRGMKVVIKLPVVPCLQGDDAVITDA